MSRSTRLYVITLVHGTFARDAAWCRSGSYFRNELETKLNVPVIFQIFAWSGINSHTARLRAGKQLADVLRTTLETYPQAAHFCIGHSHGGNVAIYAARQAGTPTLNGVVCLSTPFIVCREMPESLWFFAGYTIITSLFFTTMLAFFQLQDGRADFNLIMLMIVMTLASVGGLKAFKTAARSNGPTQLATDYGRVCPTLAIRLKSDEALIWLRSVLSVSRLPRLLVAVWRWGLVGTIRGRHWFKWYGGICAVLVAIGFIMESRGHRADSLVLLFLPLFVGAFYIFFASVILLLIWLVSWLGRGLFVSAR